MRILLVEDNADIVRTLTELLRSEGYDVEATPQPKRGHRPGNARRKAL